MAAVQSAGLTEWSRFDVPGMWSLLRDVSTVEAFRQAGAWQSTYEAAQSLARRLEWYRDGLAGKWSPDGSEAAALYLGRLDELIGSAQQLADVSVANRQALVTLANAVDEARPKLQRVYEESEAMRQLGAQAKAGASVVRRQQQLHTQATEIMESLGGAAMDSWRHYAMADDYQAPQPAIGIDQPITGSASGAKPLTEPGGYAEAAGGGEFFGSQSSTTGEDGVGKAWRKGEVPASANGIPVEVPGPTLANSVISQRDADIPRSVLFPGIAATIDTPLPRTLGSSSNPRAAYDWVAQEFLEPEENAAVRRRNPSSSSLVANSKVGSDESVMKVQAANRVGGVIGGTESSPGMMAAGGWGRPQQVERYRRSEYDCNDPWSVPGGVSPVISPSIEPTQFDPGPGVIGIDR